MRTRFKPIPGYPNYFASDDGRIWSNKHTGGNGGGSFIAEMRERKTQALKKGYRVLHLVRDGKRRTFAVHQLILLAFVGPCPEGMECAHRNGKPDDNRLSNLRWATKQENARDKVRHKSNSRQRITPEDVVAIRAELATGHSHHDIAYDRGLPVHIVKNIRYGRSWEWVK